MASLKFKLNLFDSLLVLTILLLVLIIGLGWNNQPYLGSKDVIVTVRIDEAETINSISSQLAKPGEICVDSHRYCGQQVLATVVSPGHDESTYALVKIKGLGDISSDKSVFLGHRIYANQLVQLRGNYIANGRITDFYYEN